MVAELVQHAVYALHFTKLIMPQTLRVTNTRDKNRSFDSTFVKKRTLRHKLWEAGPVSYSSDKMVLWRWVLENILRNKVL